MLALISPEERLREFLQQCEEITNRIEAVGFWEGTSADIERLLNDDVTTRYGARSLLTWNGATGSYLSRLASSGRASISRRLSKGYSWWKIVNLSPKG